MVFLISLLVQSAIAVLRLDIFRNLLRSKTSASHESRENCHHKDDGTQRISLWFLNDKQHLLRCNICFKMGSGILAL